MKKILLLTTCALIGFAMPAIAAETDSEKLQDIHSDANAINKDDTALQHDNSNIAANRVAKAQDKATGNWGKQAVDSTKIGIDQTAKGEKQAEKSVDTDTLHSDINK